MEIQSSSMTSSDTILSARNNETKVIFAVHNNGREEQINVTLSETVLDLKKKIEKKFRLAPNTLINQNIMKKGVKDRTPRDLQGNNTTLAENHIHHETKIYFSVLKNNGGKN